MVLYTVDESRGAEIAGSADLDSPCTKPISVFALVSFVVNGAGLVMVPVFFLRFLSICYFVGLLLFDFHEFSSCLLFPSEPPADVGHTARLTPLAPRLSRRTFLAFSSHNVFALI